MPEHVRLAARAAIEPARPRRRACCRCSRRRPVPWCAASRPHRAAAPTTGSPSRSTTSRSSLGARRGRTGWDLVGQVSAPVRALSVQTMTETDQVPVDEPGPVQRHRVGADPAAAARHPERARAAHRVGHAVSGR
nr:hypothetical protein [Angustibacter aerolatus]